MANDWRWVRCWWDCFVCLERNRAKAKDKTQVVARHSKLPDAKAAAKTKKFWAEALDRLTDLLEG